MIKDLRLTLNAQFYRPHATITKAKISALLDAAEANSAGRRPLAGAIRQQGTLPNGNAYVYSYRIFLSERPVHFLVEPALKDKIFAVILVLEFPTHVAILKKSCANIAGEADSFLEPVSYTDLVSTLDEAHVAYQKVSARQMTVADTAIRARSYESPDLKGSLSRFSTGRSVPYFLRVRDRQKIRSLSLSTGRLFDATERQPIDAVAMWAATRLDSSPNRTADFINAFAMNVPLASILQRNVRPAAILIDAGSLVRRMETENLVVRIKGREGRIRPLSNWAWDVVLRRLEAVYDIDPQLNIVGARRGAVVKINKRNLTFASRDLAKLRIDDNGKDVSLQKFLIANNLYTITFSDPKYVFTSGECFEDTSGVAAIASLIDILVPQPQLKNVTSEKGTFMQQSTDFSAASLFAQVEAIHAGADYLFCDDLGDEWADHIAFDLQDACVTFIHSKHNSQSTSASNLHDVVGQAIKNIGNMTIDPARMLAKVKSKLSGQYVHNKTQTRIQLARRGNLAKFDADLNALLANPRLHRKCVLACSFLSRAAVAAEFANIQAGTPVKGHIVQLMWILSSFVHAVREAQAVPEIYCKP